MRFNIYFFFVSTIILFDITNALIRSTQNSQTLTYDESKFQYKIKNNGPINEENNKNLQINTSNNDGSCEIQNMAEEMIEKLLNEKDLFTSIMEELQSRLDDNSLCTEKKNINICIQEKDDNPLTFPCTSSKYENLIQKFTFKKLCHSKIAFSNILLKPFIERNESENTFGTILKHFNVLLNCVDADLKDIYKSSIQLFTELRNSVVDLTKKLWSKKIIEILKKRQHLIAGIFCELRNGSKSNLVSNSLEFENFGILKINDENILNEAFSALSDYYYYFPYFATKLLEKGGMVEKLIAVHEKLTNYRTQHIITEINEKSKNEVLNNEEIFEKLNNYKLHHKADGNNSFVQFNEIKEDNVKSKDNINSEQVNVLNTNDNRSSNINQDQNVNDVKVDAKSQKSTDTSTTPNTPTPNTPTTPATPEQNLSAEPNDKLNNPLYSISSSKVKNIVDLIKDLFKDTNIVKFENNEPTNSINEEGIKKIIENSFLDLNDNTMLIRLLIKPQAVILSVIQSFILMTPSPERDAKAYCKKALVNDELVDSNDIDDVSEEEFLVNKFASKYNIVYEKIKLEELKEIEQRKKTIKQSKHQLSAIQVQYSHNKNANKGEGGHNIEQGAPLIAVVHDPKGKNAEDIINDNADINSLSTNIEQTFVNPQDAGGSFSVMFSFSLLVLFFFYILI